MTTEEPETPPDGGGPTAGTNWHSWAALEASLRDDAELSDDLRARTLDAVVILQALLGDEWLGQVTLDHPILSLFWNRAEWTRVRLCALADGLIAINRLPGGVQLLGRVRSEQEAGSALLEIDTAVRALTHGCTVELAPRTQGAKSCDLALASADGRRLFVEITGVAQFSSRATTQQRLLNRIYPIMDIIGSNHDGGGQLLFWPADDERDASESSREHLWSLLGMSALPGKQEDRSTQDPRASTPGSPSEGEVSEPHPRPTHLRVGQRAPERDPVGTAVQAEKPKKCSFSGEVSLSLAQLQQAGIAKLQCSACSATWAARIRGDTVLFPSHPPRTTRMTQDISRWIKQEGGWTLYEKAE